MGLVSRVATALGVAVAIFLWWHLVVGMPAAVDLRAYLSPDLSDRIALVGEENAFLYSPAFLWLSVPLRALPWPVVVGMWTAALLGVTVYLAGPWSAVVLLMPPVLLELRVANVHLLLALAIVVACRWPAAWSFVLIAKPTMGVGLLWYVIRREWRDLGIALGATAALVAFSLVLGPNLWPAWIQVLIANAGEPVPVYALLAVPVFVRLVPAALLVTWGAVTGRRWVLPVAAYVAAPVLWVAGLSILVGALALARQGQARMAPHASS